MKYLILSCLLLCGCTTGQNTTGKVYSSNYYQGPVEVLEVEFQGKKYHVIRAPYGLCAFDVTEKTHK